jgi:5-oxoprolinase (ATP-hydrolysing)
MHIHTVAAGGGSICRFDGARLRVGPESAGANPGPVCYRRNGPLTVTDCNVMLGRLPPDFFPKIFGPNGDLAIDIELVRERFRNLASEIGDLSPERLASGFLRIAVENVANAIKKISVARGYDVSQYTLVTFGALAASMPVQLPMRLAWIGCSFIGSPGSCLPMEWAWPNSAC